MPYYTVKIPKVGTPYIEQCQKYNDSTGFDLSCSNIGINCKGVRLRVLVDSEFEDILKCNPAPACIYSVDEFPRNKYVGLDRDVAEQILEKLKDRKMYLWNKSPKKSLERSIDKSIDKSIDSFHYPQHR